MENHSYTGYKKLYISVQVLNREDGALIPLLIYLSDTHQYKVDKVLEMKRAKSQHVIGEGIRYKVLIKNKEKYLFFCDNEYRWFIEAKIKP